MNVSKVNDLNCTVYSYLARDENVQTIAQVVATIPIQTNRLAGFEEPDKLKEFLTGYCGDGFEDKLCSLERELAIIAEISTVIKKCNLVLPFTDTFQIFVFPTLSEFIQDKMAGVSGFTSFKNTFFLFIHPESNLELLADTVSHEYNHAIILNHLKWLTIGEGIVAEGLAENFREQVVGGKLTPWAASLDEMEAKNWYRQIVHFLTVENSQLYQNIFTSSKSEYPLWAGYAIGYWLIKNYLQKNTTLNWSEVMQQSVSEIIAKADFESNKNPYL
jgi:Predicted Zn-dependent protease (DUF2268)